MTAASPELIRRYYPDYSGPSEVHQLQVHLLGRRFWPLIDRYVGPGDVVVDLGCGSGTTVRDLGPRVGAAIGVDIDDAAFTKYEGEGLNLIRADICDLPIETETCDFAASRWVFEHLADPAAAIAEVRRILKPGGHFLIIVPNVRHPGMMLSRVTPTAVKQWAVHQVTGIREDLVMKTYYRANTERALDRLFGEAGFAKVEFLYSSDPSYWLFSSTLFRTAVTAGRLAQRLPLERFRMHMLGVYRKQVR